MNRYRDANQEPTSPLADDCAIGVGYPTRQFPSFASYEVCGSLARTRDDPIGHLTSADTSPDSSVAKSLANILVGAGFADRYRIQTHAPLFNTH